MSKKDIVAMLPAAIREVVIEATWIGSVMEAIVVLSVLLFE